MPIWNVERKWFLVGWLLKITFPILNPCSYWRREGKRTNARCWTCDWSRAENACQSWNFACDGPYERLASLNNIDYSYKLRTFTLLKVSMVLSWTSLKCFIPLEIYSLLINPIINPLISRCVTPLPTIFNHPLLEQNTP